MKAVIAGSRTVSAQAVYRALELFPFSNRISTVISGCADGADTWGEDWAEERGIPIIFCPAKWDQQGIAAGHVRNQHMAKIADIVIVVWDGRSPGSQSMQRYARDLDKPLFTFLCKRGRASLVREPIRRHIKHAR